MPTYEYRCRDGHEFEVVQKMSDDPLEACVRCGAPAERLISAGGGLLFKGDGFYITDYRSSEYKKSAEADAKRDSGPGDSGAKDSSTDSSSTPSPTPSTSGSSDSSSSD